MNAIKIVTAGVGIALGVLSGYAGYKEGEKLVSTTVDIVKSVKEKSN